ncbi:velvet factor-domain-containing protein [Neohortaea acidophila]|uniref:Velvet factor-domain-containing protein n=1 Tax=Neohortaea acidophila TaxID=245834 RepID=A0A6A6PR49_9PEZI|nr:velvet factor-domain-containing protein [Neohortaea acidophila]KAF2481687.1 velvet factor-domain-containing protein [Neohortaea acidophila]
MITRPALVNAWSPVAYDLVIRQQPLAARACGFGERDRRVIDPPPILQLTITDCATKAPRADQEAIFAVTCKLAKAGEDVGEAGMPLADIAPGPSQLPLTHYLMGTTAASPFQGKDEHLVPGTFFVFADLSCRYPGKYKIQFRLLRIDPRKLTLTSDSSHPVVASVETDVFTVYAPKDFPGMRASTALLKALHDQGLYVSLKKGTEARKRKRRASQRGGAVGLSDGSEVDAAEFLDADPTELTESRMIAPGRGKRRRRES